MRLLALLIALPQALLAEDPPLGIVRGKITEPTSGVNRGAFLLTLTDGRPFRCTFDERTWFEALRVRVNLDAFTPADLVEVLADQRLQPDGSSRCYARTVRLAELNAPPPNPRRPVYRSVTEHIIPRGELQFAAVVTAISVDAVHLKTRTEPPRRFLLRPDTRFLEGGIVSSFDHLSVNQRVSVRAGKNVEGLLEVYQLIWGEIPSGR
jgi:hypothetical protein